MPVKRIINVDLLRILSCLGVIGLHCFQEHLISINLIVYRLCGFAVPMFFVLSGYFLATEENDVKSSLRRISKVLLVIILWNFLFWLIYLIKDILAAQSISFIELPKSILKGFVQQGRFWHFWYLAALILVYASLPLISSLLRKKQKQRIIVSWVVLLSIGVTLQIVSEFVLHQSIQRLVIQSLRLWTWLQYFLLGGVLRVCYDKWHGRKKESLLMAFVMMLVVQLWQSLMGNQIAVLYGEAFYDSIFTVLWVISIFIFVMNMEIDKKLEQFVVIVAPCTMGIYIIHPLLIRYLKRVLFPDSFIKSLLLFIVLTCISFGITYVLRKIPGLKKLIN